MLRLSECLTESISTIDLLIFDFRHTEIITNDRDLTPEDIEKSRDELAVACTQMGKILLTSFDVPNIICDEYVQKVVKTTIDKHVNKVYLKTFFIFCMHPYQSHILTHTLTPNPNTYP